MQGRYKYRGTTLLHSHLTVKSLYGCILHPCDITVTPGKAYSMPFSPQLTKCIHRLNATALHQPAALCERLRAGTSFRSNAFKRCCYSTKNSGVCQCFFEKNRFLVVLHCFEGEGCIIYTNAIFVLTMRGNYDKIRKQIKLILNFFIIRKIS